LTTSWKLAVELAGDPALYRGSGTFGQHDQAIEFPTGDIEGAFAFL
jgi:hypothetical protein